MNFEELLKYCTEFNESKNEKCLICHIPVNSIDKYVKLGCSHIYHSDCVKYKSGSIKCLYCEKSSIPSLINYYNTNIVYCKILIKTGINKGKFCNRYNCQYHKINSNHIQIINIENNKQNNIGCKTLIKTGSKTGNICGRIDCKYHNKIIDLVEPKIIFNQILQISGNDLLDDKDWNLFEV